MKYLKLFEQFYYEVDYDEYSEISLDHWNSIMNTPSNKLPKDIEFTDKEIEQIKNIFTKDPSFDGTFTKKHNKFSIEVKCDNSERAEKIKKSPFNSEYLYCIHIYKTRDEWYYLECLDIMEKYFKCDQLDGLIICLKGLKFNHLDWLR